MTLLILYLSLAILVSFLCSILEAVILSITPSFIEAQEQKGSRMGKKLKAMKANIDRPLAAILSLNTIAHTVGAAGVGAQATKVFGDAYVGWISAGLTFLILVFSEIIPKTLGASFWRSLVSFAVNALSVMIFILYPLVLLSQGVTYILSRNRKQQNLVSRAEVSAMADIGHKEGIFEEGESRILKNLIRFKSIQVENIMTPRTVVVAAQEDMTLAELFQDKGFFRFSRIPVYSENIDNITGYIHKHDILDNLANDNHRMKLKDIRRKMLVVTKNLSIPDLFEEMMREKEQVALAVDDFGGMAGIVTVEDVLETLLGMEIVDEFDSAQDMQAYARERWKRRAVRLGILSEDDIENINSEEAAYRSGQDDRETPDEGEEETGS
jgi:CBS domain containing-hemolysin-like protein